MMNIKLWISVILVSCASLQARYYHAKNSEICREIIQKHPFAVVAFVDVAGSSESNRKLWSKYVHEFETMIKSTSATEPYKKSLKSEVAFILVDSSQDAMQSMVKEYKVQRSKPQILLFKQGKVITD